MTDETTTSPILVGVVAVFIWDKLPVAVVGGVPVVLVPAIWSF